MMTGGGRRKSHSSKSHSSKRHSRMRGGEQVGAPATEPNLGNAKANYEVTGTKGLGFPNGNNNVAEADANALPGSPEIISKTMAANASGGITNLANVFGNLKDAVENVLPAAMKGGAGEPIQSGYGLNGPVGTITGPAAGPGLVMPYANGGSLRPENYPFPEPAILKNPMTGGSHKRGHYHSKRRHTKRRRFVQYGCKSRKGGSHHKRKSSKRGGCWTMKSSKRKQRGGSTAYYSMSPAPVQQYGSALASPMPYAAGTGCNLDATHEMYGKPNN